MRKIIGATVIALAAGLFAGPGSAMAQKSGGTLHMYFWENPPSTSIHEEATISTTQASMPVMSNLVLYDPHQPLNTMDSIKPELATSWSWDDAKTNLTFKLRDDVKWHDGHPFTAKDVQCTMDLLQGKSKDRFRKNPRKVWWGNLKEVTTNGDYEVTFHLGRPQPSFLAFFATGYNPVYPCHVSAAQMRTKPIGTGPFKFVEFKSNESVRLVRNPDYWKKGQPYLDAIEYRVFPNRSTRVLAFVTGDIDMTQILDLTPALVKDIRSQAPKAHCEIPPTNNSVNLIVNRDKPPFNDARLRQALALAIDRQAFNTIIAEGTSKIGGAMMAGPEGSWGMPPEVIATLPGYGGTVEANRAQARQIMESLGYTRDKPLSLKVSTRSVPLYRDPAVIMVDQLQTINIKAELDAVDGSIWFGKVARGDYAVGVNTTAGAIDDPDQQFYENYSCGSERNYTKYCNKDVDALIDQQSKETDLGKRKKLVWEIERLLAKDVARPIVIQGNSGICWQPYVKNFTMHQNGIYNDWRFDEVWLDK